MNKTQISIIRKDIDAQLKSVEKKHGINLELGHITFDDNSFSGKLKALAVNGDLTDEDSKHRAIFEKYATIYGFEKTDFNRKFNAVGGEEFQIKTFKYRTSKYPVIAKKVGTNVMYRFSKEVINF